VGLRGLAGEDDADGDREGVWGLNWDGAGLVVVLLAFCGGAFGTLCKRGF
jgi:hypothetical protein